MIEKTSMVDKIYNSPEYARVSMCVISIFCSIVNFDDKTKHDVFVNELLDTVHGETSFGKSNKRWLNIHLKE